MTTADDQVDAVDARSSHDRYLICYTSYLGAPPPGAPMLLRISASSMKSRSETWSSGSSSEDDVTAGAGAGAGAGEPPGT